MAAEVAPANPSDSDRGRAADSVPESTPVALAEATTSTVTSSSSLSSSSSSATALAPIPSLIGTTTASLASAARLPRSVSAGKEVQTPPGSDKKTSKVCDNYRLPPGKSTLTNEHPSRFTLPAESRPQAPISSWTSAADGLSGTNSAGPGPIDRIRWPRTPKDLSHVRCRFFAAGSCTAGAACSFSHEVVAPGTCALAHILPGQPISFDRKNKRAAQSALRDAQAQAQAQMQAHAPSADVVGPSTSPSATSFSTAIGSSSTQVPSSGLAKIFQASGSTAQPSDLGAKNWSRVAGTTTSPQQSSAVLSTRPGSRWPPESEEGMSPTSRATPATSADPTASASSQLSSPGSTAIFISAPSGLSQMSAQLANPSNNARSSVAVQVMLGQQARRMSSTSESLSPPRPAEPSHTRGDFGMGMSPPLAMQSSSSIGAGTGAPTHSIFGTSPFSGGSRALFMPSSYDSNEDSSPRSPPPRGGMMAEQMRRNSSRNGGNLFGIGASNSFGLEDNAEDGDDDETDDVFNSEGFLPSSLNELLTPDEVRRRASRAGMGLASPSFNPFNSQSVPPDLMLSRGRPPMPPTTLSTLSSSSTRGWGALSASAEGTNPTASAFSPSKMTPSRSLLATSRDALGATGSSSSPSYLTSPNRNLYSSTFDPPTSNFGLRPPVKPGAELSPSLNPLPAPGSLPGGLAAGLSQLHLIPPLHTGDTPPSSLGTMNTAIGSPWKTMGGNLGLSKSPPPAAATGAWGTTDRSVAQPTTMKTWASVASSSSSSSSPTTSARPLKVARGMSNGGHPVMGMASPLSRPEVMEDDSDERLEEDEIPFSMDT
ncbi:BZ3500_MvSof-1268-A1-R1_Chr1-1g01048 [Microbotryum saponariae]|uniref:BZ3500_MvSof-1268-A1-R1_Chr1-1g01048 protein n=1 Tax=Microbotryum saponariae TaxID=289078 RepID=A0A2X0KIR2_9BASI|nr:BZ3500_MvSof-1268-A1-R1_Chr1-1g01048 [Microbotryum saponariae]SCZ93289.1 BZ3501_MvSof-1269-A2-R1_Chr1-1g00645 [Microbotryum saponariae]